MFIEVTELGTDDKVAINVAQIVKVFTLRSRSGLSAGMELLGNSKTETFAASESYDVVISRIRQTGAKVV